MHLKLLHTWFLNELRPFYEGHEASVITGMVFEELLQVNKARIITQPQEKIAESDIKKLEDALLELKTYKPVQYILGTAWFYHLIFKVTADVLIPRPETEELVQKVIQFLQPAGKGQVLDIGTGSGCIPVTIKKNAPGALITAIDISATALAIAKENAQTHHTEIKWLQLDFLNESTWQVLPEYEVIISNPPYIPENEKDKLHQNVIAYEPGLALFVADIDPLLFYKKIAAFGGNHLAADGKIFMETHEDYAKAVKEHFIREGYDAVIEKDFYGKERMVVATHYPSR